jgi:hypothetical protein
MRTQESPNETFNWESTLRIDAVIVKGGTDSNVYVYDPAEFFGNGLHAPERGDGTYPDISHVEFCYDYSPEVSKTANTSLKRTYDWTIDKTGPASPITNIGKNQPVKLDYSITVDATPHDSDWAVEGIISVYNPHPTAGSIINSVTDVISNGIGADVDCGEVEFPYTIPAGGTLQCSYSKDLPDATTRMNTATAVWKNTSTTTENVTGTAEVNFAGATITEVDKCVTVVDDKGTPGNTNDDVSYGPFCTDTTFSAGSISVDTSTCGEKDVTNTATFTTNDTESTGSDSHSVLVQVTGNCSDTGGCVRSPGYWRTHAKSLFVSGPPYDATWNMFRIGSQYDGTPDNDFVMFYPTKNSTNYIQVMWTAPNGNPYYILSFQYIAAQLNIAAGSNPAPISAEMNFAHTIFSTYTPAQVAAFKSNNTTRQQILAAAAKLDQYNNGLLGPLYCNMSNTPQ